MDFDDLKLEDLSEEELVDLLTSLSEIEEYKKYNQIEYFSPYEYQLEMFDAGKDHIARYACLSNRCGKTYSGAREMAYHLTGAYPVWWKGRTFSRPIKAWAIGITTDSTRKVLQYELTGTIDIRNTDDIGTTALARKHIELDTIEKDGPAAKVIRIRHISGGISELEFRSTQQGVHTLMGSAIDFIWCDEESPGNALEIFSQCTTRLATTNGSFLMTATPENGLSGLIQKFYDTPELFIFHVGWDRVPHLTEEIKAKLIASYPEWEIDLRTKGLPSKGSGAIFQVEDSFISVPEFTIPDDWPIVAGIDFGRSRDPSTIVYAALDPHTDTVFVYHEEYLDQDRSPEAIANAILSSPTPHIPIIPPHDGNSVSTDGGSETRAAIMRRLGCNVKMTTFSNPPEVQNSISNIHKKHNGKEGGLAWMAYKFKSGTLKVVDKLHYFFKEKRSYFYITKGGKTQPKDGDDHVIDAARIAVLSIGRYGIPYGQCAGLKNEGWNNGFDSLDERGNTWWHQDEEDNYYGY